MDDYQVVVIDNGSSFIRAGFSGDDAPTGSLPSIVGFSRDSHDSFVGGEAQSKRDILDIQNPIELGVITNWYAMERIWDHIFHQELHVDTKYCPVVIAEVPMTPRATREKTVEIMFEAFQTPALLVPSTSITSLYSVGRSSGMVVDVGDKITTISPVSSSYALPHAVERVEIAGSDSTDYLIKSIGVGLEREIITNIKETMTYVSLDIENESKSFASSLYELPDGKRIKLGEERYLSPEVLFKPSLLKGGEREGIHCCTVKSILKCDKNEIDEMFGNILVCGGSSLFPGFPHRILKEITKLAPEGTEVKVIAPEERKNSAWVGGSMLGSLPCMNQHFISMEEYEESGPGVVRFRGY